MRWRFSALLLPIAMLVSPARAAPRTITAAQAACDEQAGDFYREEGMAYCLVDGIVYATAETRAPALKSCSLPKSTKLKISRSTGMPVVAEPTGHC